jgi:hypothetical protein
VTVYAWPDTAHFRASRFELRVMPNLRTFTGPYSQTTQVIDLLGERWVATVDLPPSNSTVNGAAREAFFDRLKGQAHQISMHHLRLLQPQGTLRDGAAISVVNGSAAAVSVVNGSSAAVTVIGGTPVVAYSVAQLANTCTIRCFAGKTVLAGDMLGIGGQLVRVMADATADGNGALALEFQPRARAAWTPHQAVTWNKPTANFMLRAGDGVPFSWAPGMSSGASFDLIEVI